MSWLWLLFEDRYPAVLSSREDSLISGEDEVCSALTCVLRRSSSLCNTFIIASVSFAFPLSSPPVVLLPVLVMLCCVVGMILKCCFLGNVAHCRKVFCKCNKT